MLHLIRRAGAPADLEVIITGESLFNDGVGWWCSPCWPKQLARAALTRIMLPSCWAREVAGGCALGFLLGAVVNWMLARMDEPTPR